MSLLIALPFTTSDTPLALELLGWIRELGGATNHECLLVKDCRMNGEHALAVKVAAEATFSKVHSVETPFPLPDESWPRGANHMFEAALREADRLQQDFLWLEPDCVPMPIPMRGWIEVLEQAWARCKQPFMGQIIEPRQDGLPERMMSGVAIYRHGTIGMLLPPVVQQKNRKAFDVAIAGLVVPRCQHTRLIYNFYGEKGLPPTFVRERTATSPRNALTLDNIPTPTVLFHRCKNGSLISLLREARKTPEASVIEAMRELQVAPAATIPLNPQVQVATLKEFKHTTRKPGMIVLGEPIHDGTQVRRGRGRPRKA